MSNPKLYGPNLSGQKHTDLIALIDKWHDDEDAGIEAAGFLFRSIKTWLGENIATEHFKIFGIEGREVLVNLGQDDEGDEEDDDYETVELPDFAVSTNGHDGSVDAADVSLLVPVTVSEPADDESGAPRPSLS